MNCGAFKLAVKWKDSSVHLVPFLSLSLSQALFLESISRNAIRLLYLLVSLLIKIYSICCRDTYRFLPTLRESPSRCRRMSQCLSVMTSSEIWTAVKNLGVC